MLGKLVRVNQSIPEFTVVHKKNVGVVIHVDDTVTPELLTIMWSAGDEVIECLYTDELEFVN